ncbi:hypothetical protein [Rhodococcus koreensis]
MGLGAAARALMRAAYRLVRVPFQLVDDLVLPVLLDVEAPVRREYGNFLLGCDGAAAYVLADDTAVVGAVFLRRRSTSRSASARHPHRIRAEEVVMEQHRARFRERRRRYSRTSR